MESARAEPYEGQKTSQKYGKLTEEEETKEGNPELLEFAEINDARPSTGRPKYRRTSSEVHEAENTIYKGAGN